MSLVALVVLVIERVVVQFREVQEFGHGHIECNGNLVQGLYPRIARRTVIADQVIQCRLGNAAHLSQFVDRDMPRRSQRALIRFTIIWEYASLISDTFAIKTYLFAFSVFMIAINIPTTN